MTHSLHRMGSVESLMNDYVFLSTPAMGINEKGVVEKLKKIVDIVFEAGVANIGSYETGNIYTGITPQDIKDNLKDNSRIRCTFDNRESITEVLKRLKDEELGISIVISGLIDEVMKACDEVGLDPHTINLSCGVWGRVDLLPEEKILEITTMCGHAMISHNFVKKVTAEIKKGTRNLIDAAHELSRPCVCGIFNPVRAAKLLDEILPFYCLSEI